LVTSWPFYALIGVGALGLLVNQLAYQAGPLSSSLPAIMTVGPVVSLVIGVVVFDEQFRTGPAALLGRGGVPRPRTGRCWWPYPVRVHPAAWAKDDELMAQRRCRGRFFDHPHPGVPAREYPYLHESSA